MVCGPRIYMSKLMTQPLCVALVLVLAGVGDGDQLAIGAGISQHSGTAFQAARDYALGGDELHGCSCVALEADGRRLHGVDALERSASGDGQANQRQQKHILGAVGNHALPHVPGCAG